MADLIDRQAAIESICKVSCGGGYCGIPCDEVKAIKQLPSAEPRRRGKWAGKGDSEGFGIFICDACGKFAMIKSDFCPNCGADMRPREEEQDG